MRGVRAAVQRPGVVDADPRRQSGHGRGRNARSAPRQSAFAGDQKIYAGDYARAADSNLFLITAGLRRKPDESRLDLINRNVTLFVQILDSIKTAGFRKDAHVFVVSNPVDILTQLAVQRLGLPWQQVYGLGTMLDTARFSSFIAEELKLAPTQVKALILGEHGDSMLPVWSSAAVNGLPLTGLPECGPAFQDAVFRAHEGQRRGSHQEEGRRGLGRRRSRSAT